MNLEPTSSSVEVEDVGHVDHSRVVDVELSHSQHPRQLHPLHEQRRRDVAERDGDANSELDVGFRSYWTLDGQVDGGLGAAVGDDGHMRRHRLSARQSTRKQILYIADFVEDVTARSTGHVDYDSCYIRRFASVIPDVTVVSPVVQLSDAEDTQPGRYSDSWPVVVERRVQHELIVADVLYLPFAVSSHRVRQRTPHVTTPGDAACQISFKSRATQRELAVGKIKVATTDLTFSSINSSCCSSGGGRPSSSSSRPGSTCFIYCRFVVSNLKHFHVNYVAVNVAMQRDVKYPTEADA